MYGPLSQFSIGSFFPTHILEQILKSKYILTKQPTSEQELKTLPVLTV